MRGRRGRPTRWGRITRSRSTLFRAAYVSGSNVLPCCSARGFDADRRRRLLILRNSQGSKPSASQHPVLRARSRHRADPCAPPPPRRADACSSGATATFTAAGALPRHSRWHRRRLDEVRLRPARPGPPAGAAIPGRPAGTSRPYCVQAPLACARWRPGSGSSGCRPTPSTGAGAAPASSPPARSQGPGLVPPARTDAARQRGRGPVAPRQSGSSAPARKAVHSIGDAAIGILRRSVTPSPTSSILTC